MGEDYQTFINTHSQQVIDESMLISEFFADQFAKEKTDHDYDYMLSAIYGERMTHMKPAPDIDIAGV